MWQVYVGPGLLTKFFVSFLVLRDLSKERKANPFTLIV